MTYDSYRRYCQLVDENLYISKTCYVFYGDILYHNKLSLFVLSSIHVKGNASEIKLYTMYHENNLSIPLAVVRRERKDYEFLGQPNL